MLELAKSGNWDTAFEVQRRDRGGDVARTCVELVEIAAARREYERALHIPEQRFHKGADWTLHRPRVSPWPAPP